MFTKRRGAFTLAGAALLPGCSTAGLSDLVTPRGGYTVTPDIAYGPLPRHRLDLYETGRGGPLVLFIHGGEWRQGDKSMYRFVGQALCARGFDCAVINYRLFPETRFPGFVEDAALAVRHLARPMVIMGHSSGAHVAMLLVLDPRWLAGAPMGSVVQGGIGLSGPYDFLPLDNPLHDAILNGPMGLPATQPINFAAGPAPPLLLITGETDTTVRPRNTAALAAARRAAGGVVREVRYAGVGHSGTITALAALLRPFSVPVLDEIEAFTRQVAAG